MLWSNGVMIDLNSLLPTGSDWLLQAATAINDCGQIVGYGTVDGRQGAFLLNLTTLTPSSVPPGAPAFTLTVTGIGTNFTPAATVNWNGTALATMYVSATQVSASVPASLISTPGSASVTVTSNGGTLAGATFGIHPARRGPGVPERPSRPAQSSATPRGVEKTADRAGRHSSDGSGRDLELIAIGAVIWTHGSASWNVAIALRWFWRQRASTDLACGSASPPISASTDLLADGMNWNLPCGAPFAVTISARRA